MNVLSLRKSLSLILSGMISIGSPLMADAPANSQSADVTLNDGVLTGTVVNSHAEPVSGVTVKLIHGEKVVATAVSDDQGQFAVRGLRNGGHLLRVGDMQQPIRFWDRTTAPPCSVSQLSVLMDDGFVRGQAEGGIGAGAIMGIGLFSAAIFATTYTTLVDDGTPAAASASP